MVNIHHNIPMEAVPDAAALALFEQQWTIYQACIDNDYLGSVGAYRALHKILKEKFESPFAFLDLACGDARGSVSALTGTAIAHYHGVDLAIPALERAAVNLEKLACDVELEHGSFIEAMFRRPEPADVVWIGLSLHHFEVDKKLEVMRAIRQMISTDGALVVYEPTSIDGEDRDNFLDRYETVARREFTNLTQDELAALLLHVRSCDFPESMAGWEELGRKAGFATIEQCFTDRWNLLRIFCFTGPQNK